MSDITQYYTIHDTTIGLTRPQERHVWEQSYWKYQWCSGIIMAHHLSTFSGSGQTLLELGPGLGLSAIIAKKVGFRVTVVDKMSGALEYTKKNFVNNSMEEPIYMNQTWEQFLNQNRSLFNVIIGSDVLYEPAQISIIINLFKTSLILGGVIYMAAPVRVPNVVYDKFIDQLSASKFQYTEQMITSPIPPEAPLEYDGDEIRLLTISRIK